LLVFFFVLGDLVVYFWLLQQSFVIELQYKSEYIKYSTERANVVIVEDKEKKEQQGNGQKEQTLEVKKYHVEDELIGKFSDDGARKQVKFRNDTLSFSRNSLQVQESVPRTNKLKHVKSVQFPFHSSNGSVLSRTSQFMEQGNNNNVPEAASVRSYSTSESKATISSFSDGKVNLESSIEMLEEEVQEAAAIEVAKIYSTGESKEKTNGFSDGKVELESKIEMLEEELREAAAVEVALYSVVAEHGSSAIKVHAPARRLSRFYLHSCKARSPAKRASAARTAVSGLVLVAKACGNDVPRYVQNLTW
jgi:hypothetical protein